MHASLNCIKTSRRMAMRPSMVKLLTLTKLNLPATLSQADYEQCLQLGRGLGFLKKHDRRVRGPDKTKRKRRRTASAEY